MAVYQSHTEADGKASLRDSEMYGHFAAVERINGKIGKSWHVEIEPPDQDAGAHFTPLDPDEYDDETLSDPKVVRAEMKAHKLQAQLDALRDTHTRNGYDPFTKTVLEQVLPQIIKPPKSAFEEIREAKELMAELTPRREVNQAPAPQPAVDPKVEALKLIAGDPELRDIAKDAALEIFGVKRNNDSSPWAEVANKFLDHPQFPQVAQSAVNAAVNLVGNALSGFASLFAPKPPQMPAQAPQQTAPTVQPPQQAQTAPQVAQAQTQALPEAAQQQPTQAAPEQGPPLSPQDAFLYGLIGACEQNMPIEQVRNFVNLSLIRNPELEDSLDQLLNLPTDQLLGLAVSIHPPLAQAQHAKPWLESLIAALTSEGDEEGDFDQVTEVNGGEVKL
jgi:hypothetical protein